MTDLVPRLIDLVGTEVPDMDTAPIENAYDFAEKAHGTERRRSGELFITHPLEVAMILARMQLDQEALIAALFTMSSKILRSRPKTSRKSLGHRRESRGRRYETRQDRLGQRPRRIQQAAREKERQAESLRKMFLAMVDDVRVVLIKLADRLHNMRTLEHMPEDQTATLRPGNNRDFCSAR